MPGGVWIGMGVLKKSNSLPENAPLSQIAVIRILFFLFYSSEGILFSFSMIYYYAIGMSGTQIGWINTVTLLVTMVTGVLWSLANDRLGRTRLLLLIATIGSIMAGLGLSAVRPFGLVLLMATLLNFFNRPVGVILDNVALSLLGKGEGNQYGRVRLWGAIGYSVTSLVAGYILTFVGVDWLFVGFALVLLIMVFSLFFLIDEPVEVASPKLGNLVAFLKDRDWIIFILSVSFIWLNNIGYNTFLPIYLTQMGASESIIGSLNAVQSLSEALFLFVSVFFLRRFRIEVLMVFAMGVYALRPLLYSFIPTPGWAIPLGLLHSISFGLFIVCVVNFIHRISPEGFKTMGQGLYYALHSLVVAFGSTIHGWIFDKLGAVPMLRIDAVLGVIGMVLFAWYFLNPQRAKSLSAHSRDV